MDWLNFRTVKRLKTIAIYWWTSLPIITLWVTQLRQICRLYISVVFLYGVLEKNPLWQRPEASPDPLMTCDSILSLPLVSTSTHTQKKHHPTPSTEFLRNSAGGIGSAEVHIVVTSKYTLFESENERQKIEPVPIPLPRAFRNCPDVKTRNEFFFHNWTSEIIPFIHFGMQMDRT